MDGISVSEVVQPATIVSNTSTPQEKTPGEQKRSSISSELTLEVQRDDDSSNFEKTLRGYKQKAKNEDIKERELGVVFQDLRVVGLGATAAYQTTLGSALNPINILKAINSSRHPAARDILSGFEGVVRPGEMLLVLGSPGAGCSTLLRVLANHRGDYHAVDGTVEFGAFTPADIKNHFRGDVLYSPEDDVHFATLTVQQTLDFAARVRAPARRVNAVSRYEHVQCYTDTLTTAFGLKHAKKTLVGDAAIRGVSGGEKKRVSISEMLASRGVLNCWDNSTRGLDASTALEFMKTLRLATDINRTTTVVSIYQAGESLYELFDKVCVINEGKMAYFGSARRARQYFIDLGYEPANRQTTADFLVAATNPHGRMVRQGYEARAPRTAIEFAERFKTSVLGQANRTDIDAYRAQCISNPQLALQYRESAEQEHASRSRKTGPFVTTVLLQARALMTRRAQIIRGAKATQIMQLVAFILQAIFTGTMFFNLKSNTTSYFSRGGVMYFALLYQVVMALAEIPSLYTQREIVLRHSKGAMYHPWVDALAFMLVDAPLTLGVVSIFSILLYFLTDLHRSASQFFIFLLFIYTVSMVAKSWFRLLAAAFKDPAPAQSIAGISVLIMILYTGYALPVPSMIGGLKWLRYFNPMIYGFESLMTNEFHTINDTCSTLVPSGNGYENVTIANQVCTTVGSVPGEASVSGDAYVGLSFDYFQYHLWRNFGILIAFGVGFVTLLLIMTEVNTTLAAEMAMVRFKRGSKSSTAEDPAAALDEEKHAEPRTPTFAQANDGRTNGKVTPEKVVVEASTFSFHGLNYIVPVAEGHRQLLDDVSGYVAPGKLTALMGESGAGKTTLLNVLAERTTSGVVTGDRYMNGQPLTAEFKSHTGYCQQTDTHLPTATVREALLFSAKMRQPQSVPLAEKEAYVEQCLKMCGLETYADAIVGTLDVEHRKRTTIGVELVAKPSLIFLDEPTSGLDSQSAWAIVAFLRELADSGQSIVCTIHQPSAELFEVFDRLLLLRKGGQTVYFGDVGYRSATLINYFERNGSRRCTETENPAEFILDVIGAGATATSDQDWYAVWTRTQECRDLQRELSTMRSDGMQQSPIAVRHTQFRTSWWYQFVALVQRDSQRAWRSPVYLAAKLILNIVAGLLVGFTFFKSKDSIQGTQNKLFSIFQAVLVCFPIVNQLQLPFLAMRDIYEIRERHSNMYNWTALITAEYVAEVPWNILSSTLLFLTWYWTNGFANDRAAFTYLFFGLLFPVYYTAFGQVVATISPNAEIAGMLFGLLFSLNIQFNGSLQPYTLLGWWKWMYRVSPMTYFMEATLGQALGGRTITCSADELVSLVPPAGQTCAEYLGRFIDQAGGYLTDGDAVDTCTYCAYRTADAFLGRQFNVFYAHRWRNVGIFCVYIVFDFFALYFLTWFFRIRTWSLFGWLKRRPSKSA